MELSEKFKKVRKHKKLSQTEMADNLGVAVGTYKNYELGKRIPSADLLIKLVSLFNVNPVWLLTDDGDMFQTTTTLKTRELDTLDCQILNAIHGMKDQKKKEILHHIEKEKLFDELLKNRAQDRV
jgi:transcriptional regulator with XRE-family HTH domain